MNPRSPTESYVLTLDTAIFEFRKIKYICINVNTILTAGVNAAM